MKNIIFNRKITIISQFNILKVISFQNWSVMAIFVKD